MAKIKPVAFKTPKASLLWATIDGEGKENLSGQMKYVVTAVVPENSEIVESIKAFWKTNKPTGFKDVKKDEKNPKGYKSLGIYPHTVKTDEVDEDGDAIYETVEGMVELRFSTDVTWPDGKPKVITIYNAKGNKVQLPEDTKIGNDTIGKVAGAMGLYTVEKNNKVLDAGVTLYLNGIQILKLVEYTADDGFEADDSEEDGFTGDEGWDGAENSSTEEPKAKTKL